MEVSEAVQSDQGTMIIFDGWHSIEVDYRSSGNLDEYELYRR